LGKTDVKVVYDVAVPQDILVNADSSRVKQIIMNVLSNALKFTNSGRIEFKATSKEIRNGQIELDFSVKDTGIGMAEDVRAKIFEPFNQVPLPSLSM
jgi:signal transduction histidine kinase